MKVSGRAEDEQLNDAPARSLESIDPDTMLRTISEGLELAAQR